MAESLHQGLAQWIQCKLGSEKTIMLFWKSIFFSEHVLCVKPFRNLALQGFAKMIPVSSSARVTSVKFHKRLSLTYLETTRHIDGPGLPGSDKNGDIYKGTAKLCQL